MLFYIVFTDTEHLIGDAAKNQVIMTLSPNIIFGKFSIILISLFKFLFKIFFYCFVLLMFDLRIASCFAIIFDY